MDELYVGQKFETFKNLESVISKFEEKNFVQLYRRNSETVEYALKRTPNRTLKSDLKYVRLTYACIHGGKNFRTNSSGKRPNTR